MIYEVYEQDDAILPAIALPNPCEVRVELKDDTVSLFVGPRDWCWDRKTGTLKGAGTKISPAVAANGKEINNLKDLE